MRENSEEQRKQRDGIITMDIAYASNPLGTAGSLTGTNAIGGCFKFRSSQVAARGGLLAHPLQAMERNSWLRCEFALVVVEGPLEAVRNKAENWMDSIGRLALPTSKRLVKSNQADICSLKSGTCSVLSGHWLPPVSMLNFSIGKNRQKSASRDKSTLFAFQLSFPHKTLLLMSSDQQDVNDWYQSLKAAVR